MTSLAGEAQTSEALLDYSPSFSVLGYGWTAGWSFQPATNISLTALGAFQYVVSYSGDIQVGLWDAGGGLLASNTITASSRLLNQSLYEPIAPVSLSADQTYYLGAYSTNWMSAYVSISNYPPDSFITIAPEIQLGAEGAATGFGCPATPMMPGNSPGSAFIAPNFEFEVTPVPEPTTLFLLGGGALVFTATRRRQ